MMKVNEIIEVLQGVGAGKKWEYYSMNRSKWITPDVDKHKELYELLTWCSMGIEVRLKTEPTTLTLPERTIPMPLRVAPEKGTECFTPNISGKEMVYSLNWSGLNYDKVMLERGLIYLNEDDALAAAKALAPFP